MMLKYREEEVNHVRLYQPLAIPELPLWKIAFLEGHVFIPVYYDSLPLSTSIQEQYLSL